jgi:hypothetical protein
MHAGKTATGHKKKALVDEIDERLFLLREPPVRFELTTARLRIESSTPELRWRIQVMRFKQCPGADSNRYAFRHHPLKMACLPISPPGPTTLQLEKTGPTGLEPATSRVTVECSNQTELRPQQLLRISQLPFDTETTENTETAPQPNHHDDELNKMRITNSDQRIARM